MGSHQKFKLTGDELLFFPKQYEAAPIRSSSEIFTDRATHKKNYIETIGGMKEDEKRKFRAKRDIRYLHKNADKSTKSDSNIEGGQIFCLDHLVGRCDGKCNNWHQLRYPRLLGVCKFYLMGVCKQGDLCQFMHDEFPCRYYHLDLKHPKEEKCRFNHGGPLSHRLRDYFIRQIEIWARKLTTEKPIEFEKVHMNFMNKFDEKQLQLQKEFANEPSCPLSLDLSNEELTFENVLSSQQIRELAKKNIKSVTDVNQTPVEHLIECGLSMDQIYQITMNTCKSTSQIDKKYEDIVSDTFDSNQLVLECEEANKSNVESFLGFSYIERADAMNAYEIFQNGNILFNADQNVKLNSVESNVNITQAKIENQECTDSDDSECESNLIINEDV